MMTYKKPYYIVQIGAGGNGAAITQLIGQILGTQSPNSVYIIADPDIVEEKNLKNQLFTKFDVGEYKATVLADRYATAYQMDYRSYTDGYVESVEGLANLFKSTSIAYTPVLIGAVDNNFSRKIMHQYFNQVKELLYIDVGNESVSIPSKPDYQWTKEERELYNTSGYTGQVVAGWKQNNRVTYPPVAEVFPNILLDTDDVAPSTLSCTELSASEPQRFITNRFAATAVCNVFQDFLLTQGITSHIVHFHAKKCYMRGVPYKIEEF
ncbi:thiamine biosynthesis protein ThiF [Solibacillus silvestris]